MTAAATRTRTTPRSSPDVIRAAEHFGVNPRTIYKWIREGYLPATRIGPKLIRISQADLDKLPRPARRRGNADDAR